MIEEESYCEEQSLNLLNQLHLILQSNPLIDEVGFIHPSQFVLLDEEAGGSSKYHTYDFEYDDMVFWNRDYKLGISTLALLPLYKAAKHSFMDALVQYKMASPQDHDMALSLSEINGMKHSKTLLLLSSDFGTAWNYRKLIISKKQQVQLYMDELLLSSLVLSYSPKSDHAWSHRRWVIKMIAGKCSNLQEIVGKESKLVEIIAEVRHELEESRSWSALHVADNCCFHYSREELEWNELLIKRFIGRESLWLHRRFISLYWLNQLACKTSVSHDISIFVDTELRLLKFCLTIPENDFEDVQAQALYSATYILWLTKHISDLDRATLKDKLAPTDLKNMLTIACPEKINLWGILSAINRGS